MLKFNEKVKVTTLKNLERDVVKAYDTVLERFLNDDAIAKKVLKDLDFQYKISKVVRIDEESESYFSYDAEVERTYYCSICNETTSAEEAYIGGTSHKCNCPDPAAIYRVSYDTTYEEIEEHAMKRDINNSTEGYEGLTFYYPIISQEDLFVIAQFNIKTYVSEDEDGNFVLNVIPNDGFLHSRFNSSKFHARSIFVLSKKHGLRYINPNNETILPNHNIPLGISEAYTLINMEGADKLYLDSWLNPILINRENPILDFDLIDKDLMDYFVETFINTSYDEDDYLSASQISAPLFIKTFFDYKESKKERKAGVYRFELTNFDERELMRNVKKFFKDNSRVLMDSYRVGYADEYEKLEIDDVSIRRTKHVVTINCNECYDDTEALIYNDEYGVNNNVSIRLDDVGHFAEDVFCPNCNKHIAVKGDDIKDEKYAISSDSQKLIVYDVDTKGRLVERLFVYDFYVWDSKPIVYEALRTILYEKDSPNTFIRYARKSCNEDFEKAENVYGFTEDNIQLYQTKEEIKEVLAKTDYKYSAFEEIVYNDKINVRKKFIFAAYSYMYKYISNTSLELLVRLPEYEELLFDVLNDNTSMNFGPIELVGNIQDLLSLNPEAFTVFKNLPKEMKTESNRVYLKKLGTWFGSSVNMDIFNKMKDLDINSYEVDMMGDIYKDHNIQLSSIINYMENVSRYQRITSNYDILMLWRDYLNMATELGMDLSKRNNRYPNSLKREHDIVSYDITHLKRSEVPGTVSEEENATFEALKEFEFECDDYVIIAPECRRDIVEEGYSLNHCVASYSDQVAKGSTKIVFMRKKSEIDKPLYTIEISNSLRVVQVRGNHNKSVSKLEELSFLNKFMKEKNLR